MEFPQHILITGITGCIGSAVARRLMSQGVRITGLVRAQAAPTLSITRAQRQRELTNVAFIPCHSGSVEELAQILDEVQPHAIIHLAATGVSRRERDVTNLIKSNVELTINLMIAAQNDPCGQSLCMPEVLRVCRQWPDNLTELSPTYPFSLKVLASPPRSIWRSAWPSKLQLRMVVLRLFGVLWSQRGPRSFCAIGDSQLAAGQAMATHRNSATRLDAGRRYGRRFRHDSPSHGIARESWHLQHLHGQATTIRQVGETMRMNALPDSPCWNGARCRLALVNPTTCGRRLTLYPSHWLAAKT